MLIDVIASSIMLNFIFTNPLTEKIKISNRLLIFISSFIPTYITISYPHIAFFQYTYTYIVLILVGIIITITSKNKIPNLLGMLLGYVVSVVANNLLLLLLDLLFDITVADIYSSYKNLLIFYCVYFVIAYELTKLLRKLTLKFLHYESKPLSLIVLSETILCSIFFAFNIIFGNTVGYPSSVIYYNCGIFLIFFLLNIFVIFTYISTYKKNWLLEQEKIRLNDMKVYISDIEHVNETYRQFKHDYINILSTLGTLIHETNSNELIDYFDTHIIKTQAFLDNRNTNYDFSKIKSSPLKSIFISKMDLAVAKNIKVFINIENPIEADNSNIIAIVTLLGIYLDNAIEAAENTDNPILDINISSDDECSAITIINTYNEQAIDISQIHTKGFSSKGNNRGIGLSHAEEILKNSPTIIVDTKIENDIFSKSIIIYKEK